MNTSFGKRNIVDVSGSCVQRAGLLAQFVSGAIDKSFADNLIDILGVKKTFHVFLVCEVCWSPQPVCVTCGQCLHKFCMQICSTF